MNTVPICEDASSWRNREKYSVFSGKLSSVIVTSKHFLRGLAVISDPGLLGNIKEIDVNPIKSLPAPKHCITIMIIMHN